MVVDGSIMNLIVKNKKYRILSLKDWGNIRLYIIIKYFDGNIVDYMYMFNWCDIWLIWEWF